MSVKRYSLNLSANRSVELNESLHGSLVKYNDYAPLKALLPDYRRIEAFVDELIRFKFNLPLTQSAVVKYADLTMLATERRDLDIDDGTPWPILEGIPTSDIIQIAPLRPGQAYGKFMARFNELMELRACNNI